MIEEHVDKAIGLEPGQKLWISCELESLQAMKMRIWRELQRFKKGTGKDPLVSISLKTPSKLEDPAYIILTKLAEPKVFLESLDGKITEVVDNNRKVKN